MEQKDGEKIEVWRVQENHSDKRTARVAIYFGGNGETIESLSNLSIWFDKMGFTSSYFLSYRGTGRSSGWPSENGIYEDSEALWRYKVAKFLFLMNGREIDDRAICLRRLKPAPQIHFCILQAVAESGSFRFPLC